MSNRRLADFTGAGHERGSRLKWVCWYVLMNGVFRTWWCPVKLRVAILRAFGATIGEGVQIRRDVHIHVPWYLWIGDDCWIGEGVIIINGMPVTIGNNVCISQQAVLLAAGHDPRSPSLEYSFGPITVKDGAWIAMRTIVLRDVVIGEDALIGANSFVTKSVPDKGMVKSLERW